MEKLSLFARLAKDADQWRESGYACDEFPLIGEILAWQKETPGERPILKYLREPQFRALDVYWYVRLKLGTPHIVDLYKEYYPEKADFSNALGIGLPEDALRYAPSIDAIIENEIRDPEQAKKNKLETAREAVMLAYPSYILALAMGAGKTVLIGAIIATEFAMSLRYPKDRFMKNALVFAPGTTIIESLRELSGMPYEKILPPDLHRDFFGSLRIEFPGRQKNIQAQKGSSYNLVVTNTEKISLRANRRQNQQQEAYEREEVQANLRLQTIASLPNLGIFSDEAHHTYGNTWDRLKRVRETINYLHKQTPLIAVINTTGTPYYRRQILKEVIVWYGLGEGIGDNVLKDLRDGIHNYDMRERSDEEVFSDIIGKFFQTYGDVSLPDGARAKIAFYFKTQAHLDDSRRWIEQAMTQVGEPVSQILVNTQTSSGKELDQFKRLNNPGNQKRVILLIGKGVEGWNCPSLFACALIKEQTSNNYVLQAATRCLRQVPGNTHPAKVFLDYGNARTLDKELRNNFGAYLDDLRFEKRKKETVTLRVVKTELPALEITRTIKRAVRKGRPDENTDMVLKKPKARQSPAALVSILSPDFRAPGEILMPTGETRALPVARKTTDCHSAAWKIASRYHVPAMRVLKLLRGLYPKGEIPDGHLYGLFRQVEQQQADYKTVEEDITEALALIRTRDENGKDLFEKDKEGVYVHRLRLLQGTYERMKADNLLAKSSDYPDKHDLSFHYTPYNFDSKPEQSLFWKVLSLLDTDPDDVEAFVFTGGLTDVQKTDFHFEYLGEDGRYHRYFPDFVIVKKTGEFYIIEVKSEGERGDRTVEAKAKAVEQIQKLQPDKFRYSVVYTSATAVEAENIKSITDWINSE